MRRVVMVLVLLLLPSVVWAQRTTAPGGGGSGVSDQSCAADRWVNGITSGTFSCAQPAFSNLSGTAAVTQGGTGLTAVSQGDVLYGSAANTLSRLAKDTNSTRYLSNQGASNSPSWNQVTLTNGVTGTLPLGNGGTGLTAVPGSDTQVLFNDAAAYGADAGMTYNKTTDRLTVGSLTTSGTAGAILVTNITAPSTPAAGTTEVYVDSTTKKLCGKDDAGLVACGVPSSASDSTAASYQLYGADLTIGTGTAATGYYKTPVMGNLITSGAVTSTNPVMMSGLIGKFDGLGAHGTTLPVGGVIAEIGAAVEARGSGKRTNAFTAVLGGDNAVTTANAAFGVDYQNSDIESQFQYGLDLSATAHNSYQAPAYSQADIRLSGGSTITDQSLIRTCAMVIGADNGSALADADIGPQNDQCQVPFAATVLEIQVKADAGTPNVIVRKTSVAGAHTALLSSALATAASGARACSKTTATASTVDGSTTCTNTLQNTSLAKGETLGLASGTAGGSAKRLSVWVHYR